MIEDFGNKLISNLPIGYGLHKIVLDECNHPVDYVFLNVNEYFEKYTGLKGTDIVGKSILEAIPAIANDDFDWISFYGEVALHNKTKEITQFSVPLNRTYKIRVYSPEKYYFVTLFIDLTIEEEREKVLHNIIRMAPVPIMIHAEDGEVVHISDTWTNISGYEHEDIPTIHEWTKLAYGEDQEQVIDVIDKLYHLSDRQHDGEFLVQAKNGISLLWDFYSTYLGILEDGRKIAMSVALDITKKDALQQQLILEKNLQETTLLSVGDGVITTDRDGNITLLNKIAEELTGWTQQEAIGTPFSEVFHIYNEFTKKQPEDIVNRVIKEGIIINLANSTMLESKDGTIRPIADSASPIKNNDNEVVGVVVVFRDYTEKYKEQKRIKGLLAELTETKLLLQSSLDSPKDIIIISLDTEYRYLYFNNTHKKDMKKAYKSDINIGDCIFDHMTLEDDIKRIKNNYDIALAGKSYKTLEQYGDLVKQYYENSFNPILNENGDVIGITVFAENVTKRIQMEEQIIQDEKRYKGLVENITEGVVVHAPDTTINFANTKAAKLLGLNVCDLIGASNSSEHFDFYNEDGSKMLVAKYPVSIIKRTLQPLKHYILGISQNNDDSLIWVSVNGIPLFNEQKQLEEIVISFRDITAEREVQAQLKYSAYNDYLTGLHNRRYYEEHLEQLDVKANYPLTIIMADINGLKLINDAFGHDVGDDLIKEAANLIQSFARKQDLIARIGGDEFVLILPHTTDSSANKLIGKIKKQSQKVIINSIPLSISFGYSTKEADSVENMQEIYRNAEDMMYREKLLEIPSMRSNAIETILITLYEKDPNSELHSRVVSTISEKIASLLELRMSDIAEVKTAGLLHDIGKIIIPSMILNKKGILTKEEYQIIKSHPEIGFRILNSTQNMRSISDIVLNHHERWDGTGYPRGIAATDIPLKSRIISVADAFDAMTSERSYRDTFNNEEALQELIAHSGTQFDPSIVSVMESHFDEIVAVLKKQ